MKHIRRPAAPVSAAPVRRSNASRQAQVRDTAEPGTSALADLQARADQSAPVGQLAAAQRRADESAVLQAIGWETLGVANPRRYLPAPLGYTPEQMVENGLWPAPVEEDEEEGEALEQPVEDRISEEAEEVPTQNQRGPNFKRNQKKRQKKKQKAQESFRGETVSGEDAKKKVKRGKQEEGETSEEESSGEEEPQIFSEKSESEDEGFTLVTHAKKPPSQEAQQRQEERARKRQAVEQNPVLKRWIASPDQSGTRGLQGQGSSRAHDFEAEGKAAAKAGNIDAAIEALQDAITQREADPNMNRNPDQGHVKAIKFLERLIEALRRI